MGEGSVHCACDVALELWSAAVSPRNPHVDEQSSLVLWGNRYLRVRT